MWYFNERNLNELVFSQLHINAKYIYTYSDMKNNKEFRSAINHFIVSDNLCGFIQIVLMLVNMHPGM